MIYNDYRQYVCAETMMGPNSVRVLESLLTKYPLTLAPSAAVLDLGCGTGLTSLVIARETGAKVYANDLWISAEDNQRRFDAWGVGGQVIPVHEDANDLHFPPRAFDALFSIDSYHYFAGDPGFFREKLLPFMKDGSVALIGIPGVKEAYAGRSDDLLVDWLGDETHMFKSPSRWKAIIGDDARIESVDAWEMDCFDAAWQEWFASDHEFARGDKRFFDALIEPYTCFVGIRVRMK